MFKFLWLIVPVMWMLAPDVATARQSGEEVQIGADSLSFRRVDGRDIVDMIRARLSQGDTRLRSDFATDEGNGFVSFRGHVVITELGDTVRADHVRYEKSTKIGTATGNVLITDGEVSLTAPSAIWFSETKITGFDEGVRFVDSLSVLTADRGRYNTNLERADFAGRVQLEREKTSLWADSVTYDRKTDESWATGRVAVVNRDSVGVEVARIFGSSMYRSEALDSTIVDGGVLLAQFGSEEPDTMFVSARRAIMLPNLLIATDSVVVSGRGSAIRGDSLSVRDGDNRMFGGVRAWLQEIQVSADSLSFREDGERADSVLAWGSVFVAQSDSVTGRINQMRANELQAHVVSDTLRSLYLSPQSDVLLFINDEETERLLAFRASADAVLFTFVGGEPERVVFTGQTSGTEYTENLFDRLSDLSGYIWIPGERPDRARLLDLFLGMTADRIRR